MVSRYPFCFDSIEGKGGKAAEPIKSKSKDGVYNSSTIYFLYCEYLEKKFS